jgi:gluconokinase
MKKNHIVVMGVCGCGKSEIGARLAAALDYSFVEGDAFHPAGNLQKMSASIPLTDDDRQGWLETLADQIRLAQAENRRVVVGCSSLKRRYRDILREGNADLVFVYLHGTPEQIRTRMQSRAGHFMPMALIDSQFADLEPPTTDERVIECSIDATPESMVASIVMSLGSFS